MAAGLSFPPQPECAFQREARGNGDFYNQNLHQWEAGRTIHVINQRAGTWCNLVGSLATLSSYRNDG